MFWKKRIKYNVGGCKFWFRPMDETDLLGTDFFPPLYNEPIKKEKSLIDAIVEDMKGDEDDDTLVVHEELVDAPLVPLNDGLGGVDDLVKLVTHAGVFDVEAW